MTDLPIIHRVPGTPEAVITDLSDTESYQLLLAEIQNVLTERSAAAHEQYIKAKYEVGELISLSPLYTRNERGAKQIVDRVAADIGVTWGEVYRCVRFYTRCQALGGLEPFRASLPAGKEITWTYIKRYLPAHEEDEMVPPKKKPKKGPNPPSACRYAETRLGQEWREEDQQKLSDLLQVRGS